MSQEVKQIPDAPDVVNSEPCRIAILWGFPSLKIAANRVTSSNIIKLMDD